MQALSKAVKIQSNVLVDPTWIAKMHTLCPTTGKPVDAMVCGIAPHNDRTTVYLVNHPQYKGRVDALSIKEFTLMAMEGAVTLARSNGRVTYSEFSKLN